MHTAPRPNGRGWRQVGYSELILSSGKVASFTKDNGDGYISNNELTNGAKGYNSISKHVSYVGGCDKEGNPKNTLNGKQEKALIRTLEKWLVEEPNILLLGHNQVANKACPSFSVIKWLEDHLTAGTIAGLTEGNICMTDVYGHASRLS
jgi:hypothetical protein